MNSALQLLLVEDDEIDIIGIKRALKALKIAHTLYLAKDGIEALALLRGENALQQLQGPCIVLLDLNLPRMGGLELLEVVRADPALKSTVVFVMTTSSDERDICAAYDKNIAGYMVKSEAGESFLKALGFIEHYWQVIEFPCKK